MSSITDTEFTTLTNLIAHAAYWSGYTDVANEAYDYANSLGLDNSTADLLMEAAHDSRTVGKAEYLAAARKIIANA